MRWRAVGVWMVVLSACAHGPRSSAGQPAPGELVQSTIALVEEVRGLRAKSPIQVEVLEPTQFAKALRENHEPTREDLDRLRATWVAFGLMAPSLDLGAALQGVFDEQVVGFYSPKSKSLYVRSRMPAFGDLDSTLLARGVLAHEIEHALQDQDLMALDEEVKDDEASLARAALVEGDAQLTTLAVMAKLKDQPMSSALGNVAALAQLGPDAIARIAGFSPKLLDAPLVLRETLAFPYITGLEFAGSLWQTGGFDLVNAAFRAPPVSAAQVLHPARYAKDERPRPVPRPPLPPGWVEKAEGSVGELGMLTVLEQCLARVKAQAGAALLAGDRYVVGQRPDGRLGLVWVSVWPTRKAADAFALDVTWEEPCWEKSRGEGLGAIGSEVQIHVAGSDPSPARRWTEMVVMRGLSEADSKPLLAAIAASPPGREPTPQPPFGADLALEPVAPSVPEVRHGEVSGSKWKDDGLGLASTLPAGWTTKANLPGIALAISAPGSRDHGIYEYIPTALTEELQRQLIIALVGSFEGAAGPGAHLRQEGAEKVDHHGIAGMQSRWVMEGSDFRIRVLALPVCAGRGTAILATFGGAQSAPELQKWVESFAVSGKVGPACPAK